MSNNVTISRRALIGWLGATSAALSIFRASKAAPAQPAGRTPEEIASFYLSIVGGYPESAAFFAARRACAFAPDSDAAVAEAIRLLCPTAPKDALPAFLAACEGHDRDKVDRARFARRIRAAWGLKIDPRQVADPAASWG